MKFEERASQLKSKAELLVNFTPQEISNINPDEIQRLFYDLQVYQIELEMQNDELQKAQHEILNSRNRFSLIYHQIPIGIVSVDIHGFILDSNHYFSQMVNIEQHQLTKKHFSSLILEKDKNIFINRFGAFFNSPNKKSLNLHLQGNLNIPFYAKLLGVVDHGSDSYESSGNESSKLVISITDVSDIAANNN